MNLNKLRSVEAAGRNIISPSILAADFLRLGEQINILNESDAEWIHIDVMDGLFVPNITIGTPVVKQVRQATPKVLDVHLMIMQPERYVDVYADAGADVLTIHEEATENLPDAIAHIQERGMLAGVSIKPNTPVERLRKVLPSLDLVLLMSVEPGFGGQCFIEKSLERLQQLQQLKQVEGNKKCLISIDGGIDKQTAKLAKSLGVDVLVAGSYIFNGDIKRNIQSLYRL